VLSRERERERKNMDMDEITYTIGDKFITKKLDRGYKVFIWILR